jgi:hypothetical protein
VASAAAAAADSAAVVFQKDTHLFFYYREKINENLPIVLFDSRLNSSRVNRLNKFDFPTPESPMSTTLNK